MSNSFIDETDFFFSLLFYLTLLIKRLHSTYFFLKSKPFSVSANKIVLMTYILF